MTSRRAVLRGTGVLLAGGTLAATGVWPDRTQFRFAPDVPRSVQKQCRRVEDRIERFVPGSLERPVTVAVVPRTELPDVNRQLPGPWWAVVDAARHLQWDERRDAFRPRGMYRARERTIVLSADGIDEPLISHELTHALQRDEIGDVAPPDDGRDGRAVARAVVEGTAFYVQSRYQLACRRGALSPCSGGDGRAINLEVSPELLALGGTEYAAGLNLVHETAQRGGWSAVWELHRSPPRSLADIVFPSRHFDGGLAPVSVEVPEYGTGEWIRIDDARLGVGALLTKLVALGAVDPLEPSPEEASDLFEAAGLDGVLRAPVLDQWRGDRIAGWGFVDDPDRMAYAWRTHWATDRAAQRLRELVAGAYGDRGRERGAGWLLDGDYVGLQRDGSTVTFTMAPTVDAHDALFGSGN